jgi:hypothetical protein
LEHTPARLENSCGSPQKPREKKSTADLTHAKLLQLQELGLAFAVTNTLDNESELQGFVEKKWCAEVGKKWIRRVKT